MWQFEAGVLLEVLDVDQSTHKLSVQQSLVRQSLDIFGSVRVDVLQGAGELVVEPLNERYDAAGNAEDLALCDGRQLLIILPLFGVLDDNNLLGVLEDLKEFAELLVRTASVSILLLCILEILTASTDPGACGSRYQMSSRSVWRSM